MITALHARAVVVAEALGVDKEPSDNVRLAMPATGVPLEMTVPPAVWTGQRMKAAGSALLTSRHVSCELCNTKRGREKNNLIISNQAYEHIQIKIEFEIKAISEKFNSATYQHYESRC